MKTLKGLLSFFCYFGTSIAVVDTFIVQTLEEATKGMLNINPAAKEIVFYLLILFWAIKIIWYVYDKVLTIKERNLGMDKTREQIEEMKEGHEKGVSP